MNRTGILIFFIAAAMVIQCSKKDIFEKEPNNTFTSANDIVQDKPIKGYINSTNDHDLYLVKVEQDTVFDIQLTGIKGVNCAIKIWMDEGNPRLLKLIDDTRKSSPERLANYYAQQGSYYIEVLHGDRDIKKTNLETPYELILKAREVALEESEPNDLMEDADELSVGDQVAGYFSPAYNRLNNNKEYLHREEDWYVLDIHISTGSPVLLDILLSGVSGINSVIAIYDADRNELAMADNEGAGAPEEISGTGITETGRYYILVAAKGYGSNPDEPYNLMATLREHDPGSEVEKNDDFQSSNTINNNVISGRVNHAGDVDFFRYNIQGRSSLYRLELRPTANQDAMMTVYTAGKEKLMDINAAGAGKREVYPNLFTKNDIFVSVSSRGGEVTPESEYVLTVSPLPDNGNFEQEPNDEADRANTIKGDFIEGYTSTVGDKDYFILKYSDRVSQVFEISGVRGGTIKASVTDPLGYIIKSVNISGDRKISFTEMVDRKGYIIIESISENYDSPYFIKLKR